MNRRDISHMRASYEAQTLNDEDFGPDPMVLFRSWFDAANASPSLPEPNAKTLATVDAHGRPRGRIVLLKSFSDEGFVFYTNYESAKGGEIATNHRVALTFLWLGLERQVRIEGVATVTSDADSDAYFAQRPRESQLGAIASAQSREVESRGALERRFAEAEAQYEGQIVRRPERWGGYLVAPTLIEFWQGRRGRMHDRIEFARDELGAWSHRRLMP